MTLVCVLQTMFRWWFLRILLLGSHRVLDLYQKLGVEFLWVLQNRVVEMYCKGASFLWVCSFLLWIVYLPFFSSAETYFIKYPKIECLICTQKVLIPCHFQFLWVRRKWFHCRIQAIWLDKLCVLEKVLRWKPLMLQEIFYTTWSVSEKFGGHDSWLPLQQRHILI